MSRSKGKKKEKFDIVKASESVEQQGHLKPVPVGEVSGVPVYESVDVPVGQWAAVPESMTVVEGCYVDPHGVMRFSSNDAPAVWHHSSNCKLHQPPCKRRITDPADIVYDDNKAPWCPDCIGWAAEDRFRREIGDDKPENVPNKPVEDAVAGIIGEFEDSTEFGVARKRITEEDIRKLDAVTAPAVGMFYGTAARPRAFYPSGHPRKW